MPGLYVGNIDRKGTTGERVSPGTSVADSDCSDGGDRGENAFGGAGGGGGVDGYGIDLFGGGNGDGVDLSSGEEVVTAIPIKSADGVREREAALS